MEDWLTRELVCPRDHGALTAEGDELVCAAGHRYPVVDGVAVMLLNDVHETLELIGKSVQRAAKRNVADDPYYLDTLGISEEEKQGLLKLAAETGNEIDPAVSYLVAATNGLAYKHLIGHLKEYPIPDLRLPPGNGKTLLDIGCSWGRWSIAAAKKGYLPLGIDPSLGAVMAARRLSKKMGLNTRFVVGDARFLPVKTAAFDRVFSYSVIQHFSREDAAKAVAEVGRALVPGGQCLIQMPTKIGIRCLVHQFRRKFREGQGFEVRYWSLGQLKKLFRPRVGRTKFSVDCYFGIGLQYSDRHVMSGAIKAAVIVSEGLRQISRVFPPLTWLADSVYVHAQKPV